MRVIVGGIWHETNTFVLKPTELADFREATLHYDTDLVRHMRGTRTEIGGMLDGAEEVGFEVHPTLFAGGVPSGLVGAGTWRTLAGDLLDRIREAPSFDGILLSLHGAMAVEGCDDPEGRLLEDVRELVGRSVPIVATFDLHANVSPAMVEHADALIGYDTCPHIDPWDRGHEAAHVLSSILADGVEPTMALTKPGIIVPPRGAWTERPPMRDLLAMAHEMEEDERVVCVSVAAGYPPADVSCAGMSVVVVTNGQQELAERLAKRIADEAWRRRDDFVFANMSVEAAVARAIGNARGPTVMVDLGDSVGAGAPGDGTVVLAELLRQGATGSVIALADPDVALAAVRAGVGAVIDVEVGGKADPRHGRPVPMRVKVRCLTDGEYRNSGPYMTGQLVRAGRTAVLQDADDNLVIVTERKVMPFDHEQLRSVGISPEGRRIIVVKTAISWRSAYGHLANDVIYVDTPGVACDDLTTFDFRSIPRPIFPLDR